MMDSAAMAVGKWDFNFQRTLRFRQVCRIFWVIIKNYIIEKCGRLSILIVYTCTAATTKNFDLQVDTKWVWTLGTWILWWIYTRMIFLVAKPFPVSPTPLKFSWPQTPNSHPNTINTISQPPVIIPIAVNKRTCIKRNSIPPSYKLCFDCTFLYLLCISIIIGFMCDLIGYFRRSGNT